MPNPLRPQSKVSFDQNRDTSDKREATLHGHMGSLEMPSIVGE